MTEIIQTKDRAIYRQAKCQSKRSFKSKQEALDCQPKQFAYICRQCHRWHLTSFPTSHTYASVRKEDGGRELPGPGVEAGGRQEERQESAEEKPPHGL